MEYLVRHAYYSMLGIVNVVLWILLVIILWRMTRTTRTISDTLRFMLDEMSRRNELTERSKDR
ncbi:MAG: hypothetical protein AMS16_00960 [Planctomycetes bacterium DG_58]|nr:MAG: hypothetical protein AMS16_00960 [Planctomycetes bacterium DG_58]